MTVEQYQRKVNYLDKEIAELERKKSILDSKCAELQKKIASATDTISRAKSATIIRSKSSQIDRWQKEVNKKMQDSAKIGKTLADKRRKRNDENLRLQKAKQSEDKIRDKEIKDMRSSYEERIQELTNHISTNKPITHEKSTIKDDEKFDVFISHAWEDKELFVDDLVNELNSRGIKVWYDKCQISWGDSMRQRIDNGLRGSKFGIAVISPDYISEGKYWTKAELDGLFQLESINGKSLLPIWHNITKQQVINYSPIIGNKLAMTTSMMTASEIADEMKKLLDKDNLETLDEEQY